MSWHFLQEQEEASWEANSLDGAPSALLSLIPTASEFCSPDSGTDSCRDSRYGITSRHSTDNRGADALTSSVAGSPALTFQAPVEERELRESNPACGNTWRELSVKFDLATSSWKTVHCLFAEDLPWSLVTLPRWGMMRGGELSERTMSPLRTSATESGFWPTVRSSPALASGTMQQVMRTVAKNGYKHQLEEAVAQDWATQQEMWRTPTSRDWKNARNPSKCNAGKGQRQTGLNDQLCNKSGSTVAERNGQVTPEFCEWLMGFPIGWTESAPLETLKFRRWLRSHGVCLEDQNDET